MKKRVLALVLSMGMVFGSGISVQASPMEMPDGGVFDPFYYAQSNPDVVYELGKDANALYQHYVTYGYTEGRKPYRDFPTDTAEFDAEYYAQSNPDVVYELGRDADAMYQHYVLFGNAEGRRACAYDDGTKMVFTDIVIAQPQEEVGTPEQTTPSGLTLQEAWDDIYSRLNSAWDAFASRSITLDEYLKQYDQIEADKDKYKEQFQNDPNVDMLDDYNGDMDFYYYNALSYFAE